MVAPGVKPVAVTVTEPPPPTVVGDTETAGCGRETRNRPTAKKSRRTAPTLASSQRLGDGRRATGVGAADGGAGGGGSTAGGGAGGITTVLSTGAGARAERSAET